MSNNGIELEIHVCSLKSNVMELGGFTECCYLLHFLICSILFPSHALKAMGEKEKNGIL